VSGFSRTYGIRLQPDFSRTYGFAMAVVGGAPAASVEPFGKFYADDAPIGAPFLTALEHDGHCNRLP